MGCSRVGFRHGRDGDGDGLLGSQRAMVNADHQGGGGGEQLATHPFKLTGTPLKVAQAITTATGRETQMPTFYYFTNGGHQHSLSHTWPS